MTTSRLVVMMGLFAAAWVRSAAVAQEAPANVDPITSVVTLKDADAEEAGRIVDQLNSGVRTAIDRRTNAVVIFGPPADVARATALIDELDKKAAAHSSSEPAIINTPRNLPPNVMDLIRPLVSSDAVVSLNSDAGLIVVKGSAADVDRVRILLKTFEANNRNPSNPDGRSMRVSFYFLRGILSPKAAAPAPPPVNPARPRGRKPVDAAVWDKLEQPISINLERVPLSDALKEVARLAGVSIRPMWNELESSGVDRDTPVTISVDKTIPVRVALQNGLDLMSGNGNRIAFGVEDGLVVVTTRSYLQHQTYPEVYDIADLIGAAPGFYSQRASTIPSPQSTSGGLGGAGGGMRRPDPATQNRFTGSGTEDGDTHDTLALAILNLLEDQTDSDRADELLEAIRGSVDPDSWKENGGHCSIDHFAGKLIVTQYDEAQTQVADLLNALRAQMHAEKDVINKQPLPASLAPAVKALEEQGFHDVEVLARLGVQAGLNDEFSSMGLASQVGKPLQIEVYGRLTAGESPDSVELKLRASLQEAPPLVGLRGLPRRPSLFELESRIVARIGDEVVLATAPGSTDSGQAIALIVSVSE